MLIFHLKLWDRSARCSSVFIIWEIQTEFRFVMDLFFLFFLFFFWFSLHAHAHPRVKFKNSLYVFIRTDFVWAQQKFPFPHSATYFEWKIQSNENVFWLLYKNMQIHIAAFQIVCVCVRVMCFFLSSALLFSLASATLQCEKNGTSQVIFKTSSIVTWNFFIPKKDEKKLRSGNVPALVRKNSAQVEEGKKIECIVLIERNADGSIY